MILIKNCLSFILFHSLTKLYPHLEILCACSLTKDGEISKQWCLGTIAMLILLISALFINFLFSNVCEGVNLLWEALLVMVHSMHFIVFPANVRRVGNDEEELAKAKSLDDRWNKAEAEALNECRTAIIVDQTRTKRRQLE